MVDVLSNIGGHMARYATDEDIAEIEESLEGLPVEGDEDDAPDEAPEEGTPEEGDEDEEDAPDETDEEADEAPEEDKADDPSFTVKVDGEDVEVPLSELRNGYMRTADYTRKTQLLAAQRKQLTDADALMQALSRNPQETMKVLARHYQVDGYEDITIDGQQGPSEEQKRLMGLEDWQRAELNRQREAAVDAELGRLHQVYGEFDEDALFTFAVERNVGDLETAYRAMAFGRTAPRRTEKRRVAAVAGGNGHSGATHRKTPPDDIKSFKDAYQAAVREIEANGS